MLTPSHSALTFDQNYHLYVNTNHCRCDRSQARASKTHTRHGLYIRPYLRFWDLTSQAFRTTNWNWSSEWSVRPNLKIVICIDRARILSLLLNTKATSPYHITIIIHINHQNLQRKLNVNALEHVNVSIFYWTRDVLIAFSTTYRTSSRHPEQLLSESSIFYVFEKTLVMIKNHLRTIIGSSLCVLLSNVKYM